MIYLFHLLLVSIITAISMAAIFQNRDVLCRVKRQAADLSPSAIALKEMFMDCGASLSPHFFPFYLFTLTIIDRNSFTSGSFTVSFWFWYYSITKRRKALESSDSNSQESVETIELNPCSWASCRSTTLCCFLLVWNYRWVAERQHWLRQEQ